MPVGHSGLGLGPSRATRRELTPDREEAVADERRPMMKSVRISTIPLTLAGLTIAIAGGGCHHEEHKEHTPGEFAITSPLQTDRDLVSDYVCQIHSIQHIEMRAMERGYLTDVFVDEGQFVKKGDRMFQIMPTIYQAEVEKAEAEADFARIEFKNTKLLADGNVVSQNELALAKARLTKAEAELTLGRAHRNLTDIRAPFDGIMGRLHVRRGSLLEEGELLTTLSDNSKMWVYFNVTEAEYLDYKQRAAKSDEPATVQLVMANHKLFDQVGKVETIEADFHHETGTIAFRATFPNPDLLLRHGETGKVLMTTPLSDVLVIPQKATFEVLDRRFVFVVGDDDTVHTREIGVAHEFEQVFVLAEGLKADDRILLDGLRKVREGDVVKPKFVQPEEVVANLEVPAE